VLQDIWQPYSILSTLHNAVISVSLASRQPWSPSLHVQTPLQPRQCLYRVAALVALEQADRIGEGRGWGMWLQETTMAALRCQRCQHGIQSTRHIAVITAITVIMASRQPWSPALHVQTSPSSPPSACPMWQHWLRWSRPTGSVRARAGGWGCRRRLRVHYAVNMASSQHLTTQSSLSALASGQHFTTLSAWHAINNSQRCQHGIQSTLLRHPCQRSEPFVCYCVTQSAVFVHWHFCLLNRRQLDT
jgi:hypothetical protein